MPKFGFGFRYNMNRSLYILGRYEVHYGNTTVSNATYSFDGSTYTLGVGFRRPTQKRKQIRRNVPTQQNNRRRSQNNQRRKAQSTYQKTQQLMNELSWPTY